MTKQSFEMFAFIIRTAREHGCWDERPEILTETIAKVCAECAEKNPRFDRIRFLEACEERVDRRLYDVEEEKMFEAWHD